MNACHLSYQNRLAIVLIKIYRYTLSPILGPRCRFYPSCSEYSLICFKKYGFIQAVAKTFRRLVRCGPWHQGGVDYP